ncbi:peptide/nickel transport system permease protein [Nocardia transvalensis]|uniref:Peptide/nickel transport system permease protein n=1 Tax=Nocardia transvalensis TaxID=37333 RepID=A0A7W9P9Z7_9NOCA|nr:ABC transporter permease [Nocardia transvalensis]MBB5912085.1 peptide/nickel transport system permease protein [Nocardia transvalensis]
MVSVLAPWLAPHDPVRPDAAHRYLAPLSEGHLLGTDEQGRDVFSRLLWGGRTTLLWTFAAVTAAVVIGTALGLAAAFGRGAGAALLMRVVDLLFAFPVVIVAVSLAEIIGTGPAVVALSVVFATVPYVTRIVYGEARRERGKEYVDAATVLGAGRATVLLREVLPNIGPTVLVYWSTLIGMMTVFAASLGSLGVGVQPPTPDWGRMVAEGAKVLLSGSAYVAIAPGLAILVVGVAFSWFGDGLRDLLDPRRVRR